MANKKEEIKRFTMAKNRKKFHDGTEFHSVTQGKVTLAHRKKK